MTTLIDWMKFSKELRLRFGDDSDDTAYTPPHFQKAIQDCSDINNNGKGEWAELNIIPYKDGHVIYLEVGKILDNGMHEKATQRIDYWVDEDVVMFSKRVLS